MDIYRTVIAMPQPRFFRSIGSLRSRLPRIALQAVIERSIKSLMSPRFSKAGGAGKTRSDELPSTGATTGNSPSDQNSARHQPNLDPHSSILSPATSPQAKSYDITLFSSAGNTRSHFIGLKQRSWRAGTPSPLSGSEINPSDPAHGENKARASKFAPVQTALSRRDLTVGDAQRPPVNVYVSGRQRALTLASIAAPSLPSSSHRNSQTPEPVSWISSTTQNWRL